VISIRRLSLLSLPFAYVVAQAQTRPTASAATGERGAIFGAVTDTALVPIADTDIEFVGTAIQVKSDATGRFLVTSLPPGSYIVIARRVSFQASVNVADVRAGDTLRLAFLLQPTAAELTPVVVTERAGSARLREFESRRAKGVGEFFTQQQIEARNVQAVIDLLRQSKTIRLKPHGAGFYALSGRNFGYECYMQIYIDGLPLGAGETVLTTLPSPKELMGIEIYAGAATTPIWLPFARDVAQTGCGVIMLWTRDGSEPERKPS
jgi:hypothetical protein